MPALESTQHLATAMNRLGRALRSAGHRWEQMSIPMRRSDVTVLRWLSERGECRPGDIAESLGLNPSVISRQLTSLEAERLVVRRVDPEDGRAGLVRLSPEGDARLVEVNKAYAAYLEPVIGHWDDARVEQAAETLLELAELLARDVCRPSGADRVPPESVPA